MNNKDSELIEARHNLTHFSICTCIGTCKDCPDGKDCLKFLLIKLEQVQAVVKDLINDFDN